MKYFHKIVPSEKLILKKYTGEITISDMKTLFMAAKTLRDSYPTYTILNDYRNSIFMFDKNDFVHLMKEFDQNNFPSMSKIFILESPNQFVIYNFFKDTYNFYNTQVFNSLEAACSTNGINLNLIKDFFS